MTTNQFIPHNTVFKNNKYHFKNQLKVYEHKMRSIDNSWWPARSLKAVVGALGHESENRGRINGGHPLWEQTSHRQKAVGRNLEASPRPRLGIFPPQVFCVFQKADKRPPSQGLLVLP